MAGSLVRTGLRRSLRQVRHVTPVRPGRAQDPVDRVYRQVERDFGLLAPPIALHSPAPGPLAASWLMLRESLVADGLASRAAKEAVAAAVSVANACPYCVAVHSATLYGLVDAPTADAVAQDRIDAVPSPEVRAVAAWARGSDTRQSAGRQVPPFPVEQTAELVGVAATFQYLNRMVHVFLGDSPLPPSVPASARGPMTRVLGLMMRGGARAAHEPGTAVDLLPPAQLPDDLAWARGNPHIAEAFARASAALDAAGERAVPEPVRELLSVRLDGWDGRPPGLSRAWVQDAISVLSPEHRPAGRLVLLTALASYQVDQQAVDEFRRDRPQDRTLVELTAWASMAAARRAAGWMRSA